MYTVRIWWHKEDGKVAKKTIARNVKTDKEAREIGTLAQIEHKSDGWEYTSIR